MHHKRNKPGTSKRSNRRDDRKKVRRFSKVSDVVLVGRSMLRRRWGDGLSRRVAVRSVDHD